MVVSTDHHCLVTLYSYIVCNLKFLCITFHIRSCVHIAIMLKQAQQ